jgi:hypothetical protein
MSDLWGFGDRPAPGAEGARQRADAGGTHAAPRVG